MSKVDDALTVITHNSHIFYPKVRMVSKTVGVTGIPVEDIAGNRRRKAIFYLIHLNR